MNKKRKPKTKQKIGIGGGFIDEPRTNLPPCDEDNNTVWPQQPPQPSEYAHILAALRELNERVARLESQQTTLTNIVISVFNKLANK